MRGAVHQFLRSLARQKTGPARQYGLVVGSLALVTLLRLVAPLDVAPFLLYLPLVLLLTVAFGWGPGIVSVALSAVFAAYFFLRDDGTWTLSTGEIVALLQFVLVGGVMLAICDLLRRAIIDNELTVARLAEANASLANSRSSLEQASRDAEAARAEAEAARDAAEAANRAKSAFLANMSHELRTPLSAVIGYSEMLEEEIEDLGVESLLRDVVKIKGNAKHLLSLINDVLDLSKIEANRMDTFAEDAEVRPLLEEVAATVESLVAQKGNSLALALSPGLGRVHTDVVKLRQCLLNLLGNASKFTTAGRITLAAERIEDDGPSLRFRIIDTGIGMTAEQVARLFTRFSQADESTTRRFGGTGLGLAITRAFAGLLGGTVAVESTYGTGTTFTLTIPATLPAAGAPEAGDEGAPPPAADGPEQVILVIDDDPAQRELLARFLDRQGFAVRTAPDGPEGIALARALRPRAVLLDVVMPGMDGWAVLAALKADADLAAIPVVMVTFMSESALGASLGAVEHVAKPVDWDKLRGVIGRLRDATGDILVVDDDGDARERLRSVLERDGWTVGEAVDGRDALAKVAHGPPRAILLDLTMPVMDGFAFLHALRERPGCADLPVIVFSARDLSAGDRARLEDADLIVNKTGGLRDLAGRLRDLVPPTASAPAEAAPDKGGAAP